jgi:acetoin utilization deacetylase AcuC-like enzyme
MRIIYHPDIDLRFTDFGVLIPIENDRSSRVFNELKKDFPNLCYTEIVDIEKITKDDLLLAHSKEYVDELYSNARTLEYHFLKTYELVDDEGKYHRYDPSTKTHDFAYGLKIILAQISFTHFAALSSLRGGDTFFLGGGMHHAMNGTGRGFCLLNDVAISISKLLNEKKISTAWVIDVDAHKGDGTAEIFSKNSDVTTFSIHMKEGWPLNTGTVRDPWFIPSNIDVGVEYSENHLYLDKLTSGLNCLKEKFKIPDIVYVVLGADPYEFDELASASLLNLSKETMLKRDLLVYNFLKELKIPTTYVMAGGYGKKSWEIYYQFLKFVGQCSS